MNVFKIRNRVPIVFVICSTTKCTFVFKYVHHFLVFAPVHEIEMHSHKRLKVRRRSLFKTSQQLVQRRGIGHCGSASIAPLAIHKTWRGPRR